MLKLLNTTSTGAVGEGMVLVICNDWLLLLIILLHSSTHNHHLHEHGKSGRMLGLGSSGVNEMKVNEEQDTYRFAA